MHLFKAALNTLAFGVPRQFGGLPGYHGGIPQTNECLQSVPAGLFPN